MTYRDLEPYAKQDFIQFFAITQGLELVVRDRQLYLFDDAILLHLHALTVETLIYVEIYHIRSQQLTSLNRIMGSKESLTQTARRIYQQSLARYPDKTDATAEFEAHLFSSLAFFQSQLNKDSFYDDFLAEFKGCPLSLRATYEAVLEPKVDEKPPEAVQESKETPKAQPVPKAGTNLLTQRQLLHDGFDDDDYHSISFELAGTRYQFSLSDLTLLKKDTLPKGVRLFAETGLKQGFADSLQSKEGLSLYLQQTDTHNIIVSTGEKQPMRYMTFLEGVFVREEEVVVPDEAFVKGILEHTASLTPADLNAYRDKHIAHINTMLKKWGGKNAILADLSDFQVVFLHILDTQHLKKIKKRARDYFFDFFQGHKKRIYTSVSDLTFPTEAEADWEIVINNNDFYGPVIVYNMQGWTIHDETLVG